MEIIDNLNLGQWATFVIVVSVLWKTVFKSLVDSWFKNRLELQKQEVGNALQIQKDIALKQAEFEKVKLERVLPLFEEVNSAVSMHKMIFSTYIHYVVNKCGDTEKLEEERLKCDERMISAISSLSIYLPDEFRKVVYKLRLVVSCYARDPIVVAKTLRSFGAGISIPPIAQDLYTDLISCFHAMCAKYLGVSGDNMTYSEILTKYSLDSEANTLKEDSESVLAYKFLLLHEYFSSGEQLKAQTDVEKMYNERSDRSVA